MTTRRPIEDVKAEIEHLNKRLEKQPDDENLLKRLEKAEGALARATQRTKKKPKPEKPKPKPPKKEKKDKKKTGGDK